MGSPFAMKHRRNPIHGMSLALHSSLSTSTPSELPSVASMRDKAQKVGRLKKLSGKGILTAGTWRERFCLLVKSKLYFYESEDSTGSEKSAGFVNLEYFDTCTEASTRMARKATNVFVIGSTEKGFFESHSGRHYFAAETLPEMKEWVNAINVAMNHVRSKEKRTQSRDSPHLQAQKQKDSSNGTKNKPAKDDENSSGTGTLPRTGARLDHVTKGRVKGPPGRRLPRKSMIKSLNPGDLKSDCLDSLGDSQSDEDIVRDVRGRATSLSALEASSETHPKASSGEKSSRNQGSRDDDEYWGNRSTDFDAMDTSTTLEGNASMAYRYSSSEESFEEDDEEITIPNVAKGNCRQSPHLSASGSFNRNKSQTGRSNSSGSGYTRGKGVPVRNSSVTPPPCVLRKFRRDQMSSSNGKPSKEEDPPPPSSPCLPEADMNPRRTSSGSSLSTLTADTYNHGQISRQMSYSSLQRPGRRMSAVAEQTQRPNYPQRNSSSANASPLMNGSGFSNGISNGHSTFNRNGNGFTGNSNSFNSSASSNGSGGNGNSNGSSTRGFQIERNIYSVKKELESVSFETRQLDIDITTLRQDVGSVQENIVTVRGALDVTRERVGRLSNQVLNVERQIASIIKEATNMREQAKKLLESAEIAKATHENMVEEAENLLVFLRQSSSCFSCHHQHSHQHMRPPFQANCCSSPSPVPTYYGSGVQQQQTHNQPYTIVRRKSKSKTPDRSLDSEAEMELLDESETIEIPKHRISKTFHSNSSSAGSTNSNRTSVIEMTDHPRPSNGNDTISLLNE